MSNLRVNIRKWKWDNISNIPIFRYEDIEAIANVMLEKYKNLFDNKFRFTPIIEIIASLEAEKKLIFGQAKLEKKENYSVRGKIVFKSKDIPIETIIIDSNLFETENDKILRFTIAHELGHWVLHRHKKILINNNPYTKIEDTDENLSNNENKTPYDWLEFQANTFAACVLMPKAKVIEALIDGQEKIGISYAKRGKIMLTDGEVSLKRDYYPLLNSLQTDFRVSNSAISYRLNKLGLIEDLREKDQYTKNWFKKLFNRS